ncbi:Unsaturated rhamnogalacturonyl hydrolase YteR [Turicibacter sanguinis]|nr:Unsaturated rhamnogalacturonyl hydrolase YteR [Turicibacter sanguinis]
MQQLEPYFKTYLKQFKPYKGFWCYEDGVILKGAVDLYRATNDDEYWSFVERYLNEFVDAKGTLKGYKASEYNIDHVNAGKVLFDAYQKTKDERYKVAIEHQMDQLRTHPRTKSGNFWHKNRYPYQVWLDGLYMALPFYTQYETVFNGLQNYEDIYHQFMEVYQTHRNSDNGLYYHAFDESKSLFWCDKETGLSPNYWLRAEGWLLMALIDSIDQMSETIFEYYKGLIDMFIESIDAILPFQDQQSGLWYQVIDQIDREGNYLEVSGSAMVIYSILKAIRLDILDKSYAKTALKGLQGILDIYGYEDSTGYHIGGICEVAGLGSFNGVVRDGSFDYYISEKVVPDEAKGIGPLMMAYAEYLMGGYSHEN